MRLGVAGPLPGSGGGESVSESERDLPQASSRRSRRARVPAGVHPQSWSSGRSRIPRRSWPARGLVATDHVGRRSARVTDVLQVTVVAGELVTPCRVPRRCGGGIRDRNRRRPRTTAQEHTADEQARGDRPHGGDALPCSLARLVEPAQGLRPSWQHAPEQWRGGHQFAHPTVFGTPPASPGAVRRPGGRPTDNQFLRLTLLTTR